MRFVNIWRSSTVRPIAKRPVSRFVFGTGRLRARHFKRPDFVFFQGQIVKNLHMYGALMQSVDRDDYNGSCKCGEYPVLKAIFDGVRGLPELPPDLATCRTFALLPRDRK